MTAFADLADLRTAVVEQVGSSDIADVFPRLVLLAEAGLNRKLRLRDQITSATLTLASGSVSLPSDFLEMIGLFASDGSEYAQQTQQAARTIRHYYAIDGSNLTVYGYSGNLAAQYYAKLTTISGSMTASNWLLQKYPGIYLYAASYEAAKWMRDRDLASDMAGLLTGEIADSRADDERAKYSRARVRVQGVSP